MAKAYRLEWEERRDGDVFPAGHSLHISEKEAAEFVQLYWKKLQKIAEERNDGETFESAEPHLCFQTVTAPKEGSGHTVEISLSEQEALYKSEDRYLRIFET